MTVKEYLNQAYRLSQRIELHKQRIDELRSLACSVSSPGFEEHFNPNRNKEAPFVKILYKISEKEKQLSKELNLLIDLEDDIRKTISLLDNIDERLVLEYKYLSNYSWGQIAMKLYVDERTVRRWHNRALSHIKLEEF